MGNMFKKNISDNNDIDNDNEDILRKDIYTSFNRL